MEPVHGKRSAVDHRGVGCFTGLATPMQAGRYHSLAVARDSAARRAGGTATSPDGLVMGLRHRTYPVEGIQFHPESILTTDGMELLANWLRSLASAGRMRLTAQGRWAAAIPQSQRSATRLIADRCIDCED